MGDIGISGGASDAVISLDSSATDQNIPSSVVKRDSTGSFSAGVITGNKLNVLTISPSTSNAGSGTLSAGTVTISTNQVTASSLIFISRTTAAGGVGELSIGSQTVGTGFVVNSTSGSESSSFNWLVIN